VSSSQDALSRVPCSPCLLTCYFSFVSFELRMISFASFFLRVRLTAKAVSPPVETTPATTICPMAAKQNGHTHHLSGLVAKRDR
jgi:hypothetical protein